jgi:hypothetical protein
MTIDAPHLGHGRESLLIPMVPFGFDSGAMPGDVVQHMARTSRSFNAPCHCGVLLPVDLRNSSIFRSMMGNAVWVVGFCQDLKRLKAFLERRHLSTTGIHTFRARNLVNLRAPSRDCWSKQDSPKLQITVAS